MIRLFAAAVALLLAVPVLAAPGDVRRFPAQAKATAQLRIHGTALPCLRSPNRRPPNPQTALPNTEVLWG